MNLSDVGSSEAQDTTPQEFLHQSQIFCQVKKYQTGFNSKGFCKLRMPWQTKIFRSDLFFYHNSNNFLMTSLL